MDPTYAGSTLTALGGTYDSLESRAHDRTLSLVCAAIVVSAVSIAPRSTYAAEVAPETGSTPAVSEIIVTANKRQESIQNVGMSIQAASGDRLTSLGIINTAGLQKIVPGFLTSPTIYGTTTVTIRGVGFQDTALAGNPTVSIYLDEAPLPVTAFTSGVSLDTERVEVLKGPQGTLFGNNSTGGAINYIANKPTDNFSSGFDVSYGRFQDANIQGFVSGPITNTLDARLALNTNQSGPWQKSYGPQTPQSIGGKDFWNGRASLLWKPAERLKFLLTISGWKDKGFDQIGQLSAISPQNPIGPVPTFLQNFPLAPHNDQAADFNSCVNVSPFDPIANQSAGALWLVAGGHEESMGPGSVAWAGGQPTDCVPPRRNNTYYSVSLRTDYTLVDNLTLASLTEYQQFNRHEGIDSAGLPTEDYQSYQIGKMSSVYQELRLAGTFFNKGHWIVGGNYEHDAGFDSFLETFNAEPFSPLLLYIDQSAAAIQALERGNPNSTGPLITPDVEAAALGPDNPRTVTDVDTYAVFANGEYPILSNLRLQAGVRFTQRNETANMCDYDGGDGTVAEADYLFAQALGSTAPVLAATGGCATLGLPDTNYNALPNGWTKHLDENNVSWRVGLDWNVDRDVLLYANVSKGYKSGSFPTISYSAASQMNPVVQEELLAYEIGFKSAIPAANLTFNGAAYYYDYTNKQILGDIYTTIFGAQQSLVNIPKSHVEGFELSTIWNPGILPGLTITAATSYQYTSIDESPKNTCNQVELTQQGDGTACVAGDFYNLDPFNHYANFANEHFPDVPAWQASIDAEYDHNLNDKTTIFIGGNIVYASDSTGAFVDRSTSQNRNLMDIPAYTLLDLRAGVRTGSWRVELWGRNATNTWYWVGIIHAPDTIVRYTGMPVTYGITASYRFE